MNYFKIYTHNNTPLNFVAIGYWLIYPSLFNIACNIYPQLQQKLLSYPIFLNTSAISLSPLLVPTPSSYLILAFHMRGRGYCLMKTGGLVRALSQASEFAGPSLCWMPTTNACRMLQALGVDHHWLDKQTQEQRLMRFWHLNLLNKGLAIIFGRTPKWHNQESP